MDEFDWHSSWSEDGRLNTAIIRLRQAVAYAVEVSMINSDMVEVDVHDLLSCLQALAEKPPMSGNFRCILSSVQSIMNARIEDSDSKKLLSNLFQATTMLGVTLEQLSIEDSPLVDLGCKYISENPDQVPGDARALFPKNGRL